MSVAFEPFSPHWRSDPYPLYRQLRDSAPVHRAPESGIYCLSRHEDVSNALKDPESFSSSAMNDVLSEMAPLGPRFLLGLLGFLFRTRVNPFEMRRRGSMIAMDGARHDRMRRIVNRGFVPRRIAAWESRARELVVESLAALRPGRPFDVIGGLAVPLPVTIIAEMLGVETSRRHDFKRWSDVIIHVASGAARGSSREVGRLVPHFTELYLYLQERVRERRDAPADDLISVIVDPSRDAALDELDAIQFIVLLLLAGNETTTNLIGNAVHALLDRPEIPARMAERPQDVPAVVEEALRFDSPIQMVFRQATREVALHGTRVPAGSPVALLLGSANRDERAFPDPDRFDPDRDTRAHLGFGFGPHFCLGSALARLEARVALTALAPALARCKRVGDKAELVDSFLVRGRSRLEIELAAPHIAPDWEAA
jgi:cytochrome P450